MQMFMTHPEVEGVAETTEETFAAVWEPKGWVRATTDSEGNPVPPTPETQAETGAAPNEVVSNADDFNPNG